MNSFKEFILSFLESAKDRLKNPIIGTFVLSWFAVNWRFVSILFFSQKTIEQKIDYVECHYFDINYNLWIPLAVSVFYVLILPYVMALFDWLAQKGIAARKLISKNQKIKDIQYRQEIAAEEWQLEKIREGSPDISRMKERIRELESLLSQKEKFEEFQTEDDEASEKIDNEPESNKKAKRPIRKKTTKKTESKQKPTTSTKKEIVPQEYPIMKDIVIRDLAKTEREWILIYALYSSNFGKEVFTREDLMTKYSDSSRRTDSRIANFSNNIKNMVKSGQIKFINDDDMLLTSSGVEIAKEILNR